MINRITFTVSIETVLDPDDLKKAVGRLQTAIGQFAENERYEIIEENPEWDYPNEMHEQVFEIDWSLPVYPKVENV